MFEKKSFFVNLHNIFKNKHCNKSILYNCYTTPSKYVQSIWFGSLILPNKTSLDTIRKKKHGWNAPKSTACSTNHFQLLIKHISLMGS